ncbi:MAG: hypothetical protein L0Z63_05775, partial [Actinobacteria bacterium]|nr:hypothetical protein [Actinomycetota bacterium]
SLPQILSELVAGRYPITKKSLGASGPPPAGFALPDPATAAPSPEPGEEFLSSLLEQLPT